MTRTRNNNGYNNPDYAAIVGVPPLDKLPTELAKVIEEIRALTDQQRDALTTLTGLQDPATIEAAQAHDRAEHGRQIRAGKRGVIVQDEQDKLAQLTAAAQHDLDGINAAIAAAYKEFWEHRNKADDNPDNAAKAKKLAKTVQTTLDAFLKAYTEYDQHDMLRAWYHNHTYQPVKPFPLIELVASSRNGSTPEYIGVDINDLVTNLKKEIINDSDI